MIHVNEGARLEARRYCWFRQDVLIWGCMMLHYKYQKQFYWEWTNRQNTWTFELGLLEAEAAAIWEKMQSLQAAAAEKY